MKMILAEFSGKRAGQFRLKPVWKLKGNVCKICGSSKHVGRTRCPPVFDFQTGVYK